MKILFAVFTVGLTTDFSSFIIFSIFRVSKCKPLSAVILRCILNSFLRMFAQPSGNKYLSDSEKGLFLNPESKKLNRQN
jgi:hypothetical protein